jgi:flagellin-like protein
MYRKTEIGRNSRGVSPVIATILLVAVTVVLAAILYVMTSGLVGGNTVTPMIGATKTHNDVDTIWTVNAITGGGSIRQTDIYIQLKNDTGFIILTQPLFTVGNLSGCNGSHGFHFVSSTTSGFVSVGDSFFLNRAYTTGCTLTLVTQNANSLYAVFTV